MKPFLKNTILFITGGFLYLILELIFRGRTHWSMFFVGGLCFLLIGGLNDWFPWEMSVLKQMAISAVVITAVEFVSGIIINIWLGWNVWDYSNLPCNVLGQICLPFSALWFLVSFAAIYTDDILRWKWFGERFPEYYFFRRKNRKGR